MHCDFSVINWSNRNSMNNVQERRLTISWGIYTQQPYHPFRKRICVNTGACSHIVYLPHGYWEKWSYCGMSVVSNFQVQSVAIIKDSVTYGSGADIIFFPCLVVGKVSESLFRNFFYFLFNFCLFVLVLSTFSQLWCLPYAKKHQPNWINPSNAMRIVKQHYGTVIIPSCFPRWPESLQRIEVRKYNGNIIVTLTR